jgi:hypothetical protein
VRLIEIGRLSHLSGIAMNHELCLSSRERRPMCDAPVIMQFGVSNMPNFVPWSSASALTAEGVVARAMPQCAARSHDTATRSGSILYPGP